MPGTITFKPLQAKLNHDTDLIGKADPYCMFTIGTQKLKGQVCKSGGKNPVWNDSITIPSTGQPICLVEVKDKDILKDDKMGAVEVDLREIESQGKIQRWYPLHLKNKTTGELLMEAIFTPDMHSKGMPMQTGMQMQMPMQTGGMQMGMPNNMTMMTGGMHAPNTQQKTVITKETHLIGGTPLNTNVQSNIPTQMVQNNQMGTAEQYAREALIRGVDPLGTHLHQNQYPQQQMPMNNFAHPQGMNSNQQYPNQQYPNQQYPNQQMPFGQGQQQYPNKF